MAIQNEMKAYQPPSPRDQRINAAVDAFLDGDKGPLDRLRESERTVARCRLANHTLGKRDELGLTRD